MRGDLHGESCRELLEDAQSWVGFPTFDANQRVSADSSQFTQRGLRKPRPCPLNYGIIITDSFRANATLIVS